MKDQLIEKLKKVLTGPIKRECQVMYIMVEIRKILDRDKSSKYPLLRFYRDWAVHTEKDRITNEMGLIMEQICDEILWRIKNSGNSQNIATIQFFSMQKLRKEIQEFLKEYNLSDKLTNDENQWIDFWMLLANILVDQPIKNPTDKIKSFYYSISAEGHIEGNVIFKQDVKINNQRIGWYKIEVEKLI